MYCIVMSSIFVNCPAVICLPNIASYLRETPLVICGPWSYFYILFTTPAAIICFLLVAVIPTIFHTLLLTLCSTRPQRLTTLCFELGKVLVCFCADSTLLKAPWSTRWCLGMLLLLQTVLGPQVQRFVEQQQVSLKWVSQGLIEPVGLDDLSEGCCWWLLPRHQKSAVDGGAFNNVESAQKQTRTLPNSK